MSELSEAKDTKVFLTDLLTAYGATLREDQGVLHAELPEEGEGGELRERLGHELALVFDAADLQPGRQLVAPGSHVLREIEAWLSPRGRRSYVIQPGSARLNKKALTSLFKPSRGLDLRLEGKQSTAGYDLYVVYRMRFRSMARQEELQTVRVRVRPGAPPAAELAEPPAELSQWPLKTRKQAPRPLLDDALGAADRLVVAGASAEAKERRSEARKRFGKDVSRLNAYYAAQVAEILRKRRSDLGLIRVEELEEERNLRLKELAQASEVSVEVESLQLLTVEVPLQVADAVLHQDGEARGSLPVTLNKASGALSVPPCPSCAGDLSEHVGVCNAGHVVHETCLGRCDRCGGSICGACESAPCGVCAQVLCPGCGATCATCARPTCAEHGGGSCSLCHEPGCAGCLVECDGCGESTCKEHLAGSGLCTACAVNCPGCKQPSDKNALARCETCGRKFCASCLPEGGEKCVLCS